MKNKKKQASLVKFLKPTTYEILNSSSIKKLYYQSILKTYQSKKKKAIKRK
jgi:hypothetical protein